MHTAQFIPLATKVLCIPILYLCMHKTYRIRKNIGGSNIWRMMENIRLARF